jgi:hypothetical protein
MCFKQKRKANNPLPENIKHDFGVIMDQSGDYYICIPAELYSWCTVVECDEAYTSKTCGKCGKTHAKLGSNKTFKCPKCDHEADRDISAARNILLRYLTLEIIGPSL